jgi:hypothetical protein
VLDVLAGEHEEMAFVEIKTEMVLIFFKINYYYRNA